jgi:hypothetical protein
MLRHEVCAGPGSQRETLYFWEALCFMGGPDGYPTAAKGLPTALRDGKLVDFLIFD